jgi:GTP-binding protein
MFIDKASISIWAGKGGDGVVHFRREKFVPFGGPDGGDGGKGGNVILEASSKLTTLSAFRQKKIYRAQNGANGAKQKMTGRSGNDIVIRVPTGTIVYDEDHTHILGDLVADGQRLVVVKGGRGGRGNVHFKNSRNQAPRIAEKGEPAQSCNLHLELRLIADIGIIGLPNVGKSTLLASVTNARPKIASYPFTTIEPNLGVADLDGETSLVIADIPGLIEGAHLGLGLGHDFLRHIQRTRVLIHLLDGTSDDLVSDYSQINSELALFDPDLANKPQLVAINKIDLPEVSLKVEVIKKKLSKDKKISEIYAISGLAKMNVRELFYRAAQVLKEQPQKAWTRELPVYRFDKEKAYFKVIKEDRGWRVQGEAIERAAAMTYWEYSQSVRRFQRILHSLGIEDALRDAGVKTGDTVFIGEYELEWED